MVIKLNSPEANAYSIMNLVRKLLEASGRHKEIPAVINKMKSGDYDHLCKVASEATEGIIQFQCQTHP